MVSPGARLVRVEHVGRVEGGSSEPVATHYEYAPFGVVIVGTGAASFGGCGCLILHEVLHEMGLRANEKEYNQGNYRRDNAMVLLARELLKGSKFNCKGYDIK